MTDDPLDLLNRFQSTTDRLRMMAESNPDPAPKLVKRPAYSPSGASARSMKARNAYHRVNSKRGKK